MKKNDIIRILILVFAVLIAALVIGGGIYLFTASKKVKALQITPDFTETELNINGQYSFTVSATPAKASIKKVDCIVDDPTATFEMEKDGKATLITGGSEGTVTVYIEYKDIKSNVLTFQVVDQAAKAAAEAAAAAEAQAAAEAEAAAAAAEAEAAAAKKYVQMTGDNVNVRAQNNTDCDILGKAKKGEMFEKVEDVDEWSHIMFNGQDGYIKSEFLTEITEEQFLAGGTAAPAEEEKKEEQQPTQEVTPEASTDDAAKAAAEAQAQQELLAQAMAAAATAAPAATGSLPASGPWTYQGVTFTANQVAHFHALWDYTGDAAEMVTHHSAGELQTVCDVDGVH